MGYAKARINTCPIVCRGVPNAPDQRRLNAVRCIHLLGVVYLEVQDAFEYQEYAKAYNKEGSDDEK